MANDPYLGRLMTADEALAPVKSGTNVFVGSGAAEPQFLVEALSRRAPELADTGVTHILTLGTAPYTRAEYAGHLRHNALFIGDNVRDAVRQGAADYTPCLLHEIPMGPLTSIMARCP